MQRHVVKVTLQIMRSKVLRLDPKLQRCLTESNGGCSAGLQGPLAMTPKIPFRQCATELKCLVQHDPQVPSYTNSFSYRGPWKLSRELEHLSRYLSTIKGWELVSLEFCFFSRSLEFLRKHKAWHVRTTGLVVQETAAKYCFAKTAKTEQRSNVEVNIKGH